MQKTQGRIEYELRNAITLLIAATQRLAECVHSFDKDFDHQSGEYCVECDAIDQAKRAVNSAAETLRRNYHANSND